MSSLKSFCPLGHRDSCIGCPRIMHSPFAKIMECCDVVHAEALLHLALVLTGQELTVTVNPATLKTVIEAATKTLCKVKRKKED